MIIKEANKLTKEDLEIHSLWKYIGDDERDTMVTPEESLEVDSVDSKIIKAAFTLSCGEVVLGSLANIVDMDAAMTEHFLLATFFKDDTSFTLARYHDVGASDHGPQALADFLEKDISDVFPIQYVADTESYSKLGAISGVLLQKVEPEIGRKGLIDLIFKNIR